MSDSDAIAFFNALPPDERAALDTALREQPALARVWMSQDWPHLHETLSVRLKP